MVNENNELVSIDEGDIGKRVGIIGRRKWIIKNMNKDLEAAQAQEPENDQGVV